MLCCTPLKYDECSHEYMYRYLLYQHGTRSPWRGSRSWRSTCPHNRRGLDFLAGARSPVTSPFTHSPTSTRTPVSILQLGKVLVLVPTYDLADSQGLGGDQRGLDDGDTTSTPTRVPVAPNASLLLRYLIVRVRTRARYEYVPAAAVGGCPGQAGPVRQCESDGQEPCLIPMPSRLPDPASM